MTKPPLVDDILDRLTIGDRMTTYDELAAVADVLEISAGHLRSASQLDEFQLRTAAGFLRKVILGPRQST